MNTSRFDRQRGVAMIELTIVLPVVLLLLFGVAELGRAMMQYNTLTKAVRDGGRYASAYALFGTTGVVLITPQLEQEVRNMVVYGNPAGNGSPALAGLAVSGVTVEDVGGQQVRVEAEYAYQPMLGSRLPALGRGSSTSLTFTMQTAVTMRAL